MKYINPEEFSFVKHWNNEEKKYIASFFYNLQRRYFYIDPDEFLSFLKTKIFQEYKKNKEHFKVNALLLGSLRVFLYRENEKRKKQIFELIIEDIEIFKNNFYETPWFDFFIKEDIEKICCKKTAIAVEKKMKSDVLTSNEYTLLKKYREKIIEYCNL